MNKAYLTARSTSLGIVRNEFDAIQLPSISLDTRTDYAAVVRLLDDVDRTGGWVIFYSHDVSRDPSRWGVTPDQFEQLVCEVRARNLDIATIGEATGWFQQRSGKAQARSD